MAARLTGVRCRYEAEKARRAALKEAIHKAEREERERLEELAQRERDRLLAEQRAREVPARPMPPCEPRVNHPRSGPCAAPLACRRSSALRVAGARGGTGAQVRAAQDDAA